MRWARTMLTAYSEAAKTNVNKAESLVAEALTRKEHAQMCLTRAEALANELAQVLDHIDW